MRILDSDAPKASKSTYTKARKRGDKLYRPFGLDNPEEAVEMLVERYGEHVIARIFSKLTDCVIIHKPNKDKT